MIVTNYHVIENAKKIKIKGINCDFSRSYSAIFFFEDKNNDLAILKIDDYSFSNLGIIP
jgi:S1-C subfamily serine protease